MQGTSAQTLGYLPFQRPSIYFGEVHFEEMKRSGWN